MKKNHILKESGRQLQLVSQVHRLIKLFIFQLSKGTNILLGF